LKSVCVTTFAFLSGMYYARYRDYGVPEDTSNISTVKIQHYTSDFCLTRSISLT
jgi:hypothetical protein